MDVAPEEQPPLDGLSPAECNVIDPLDGDSPKPLWQIAEEYTHLQSLDWLASYLGPAVVAMASHECIEVRRFATWPPPTTTSPLTGDTGTPRALQFAGYGVWAEGGVPVDPVDLVRAATWAPGRTEDLLVVCLTQKGAAWL